MAKILWWGRSDIHYSRNRICRQLLQALGHDIEDFVPTLSAWGDIEAQLRGLDASLVWVPCFRHRDVAAASRWARRRGIPVLFDPLISAWQKQVFERRKFSEHSIAAKRCLQREAKQLQSVDMVLLDTEPQRQMFMQRFALPASRTACVYVGAEQPLFSPAPTAQAKTSIEVLFYGSFIALHGVHTVIEAAKITAANQRIQWVLLGEGPARAQAELQAAACPNVRFEASVPYTQLSLRIAQADIVLGVFSASEKASHVMPNKVFQALACGRPVITRASAAYPSALTPAQGLWQIAPDSPQALAAAVLQCAPVAREQGAAARDVYQRYFSPVQLQKQLNDALHVLGV